MSFCYGVTHHLKGTGKESSSRVQVCTNHLCDKKVRGVSAQPSFFHIQHTELCTVYFLVFESLAEVFIVKLTPLCRGLLTGELSEISLHAVHCYSVQQSWHHSALGFAEGFFLGFARCLILSCQLKTHFLLTAFLAKALVSWQISKATLKNNIPPKLPIGPSSENSE